MSANATRLAGSLIQDTKLQNVVVVRLFYQDVKWVCSILDIDLVEVIYFSNAFSEGKGTFSLILPFYRPTVNSVVGAEELALFIPELAGNKENNSKLLDRDCMMM